MTVNELLHDAEHAYSGQRMAEMMRDAQSAGDLREKRDRLIDEALALDPQMTDEAWEECDPFIVVVANRRVSAGAPRDA